MIANLPYVTDSTIFERSPEIRREPRIAVTGDCGEDGLGVIRGLIAETPSRLADGDGARHPPRPGDARDAARRDDPAPTTGRRAGDGRPGSMSDGEAPREGRALAGTSGRARRSAGPRSSGCARKGSIPTRTRLPGPRPRSRTILAAHDPERAGGGRARRVLLPDRRAGSPASAATARPSSSTSAT